MRDFCRFDRAPTNVTGSCSRSRATTGSTTRYLKSLLDLGLVLVALMFAAAASADGIEVRDARLEPHEDGWVAAAEFDLELNPRLEEAINKGVPLYFNYEFELARPRWYWFDERPVQLIQSYKLSYHALTRQYRLSAGSLYQSFTTLDEALRLLSRPRQFAVDRARVRAGDHYIASVRMRLDVTQLPKPFQIFPLTNRDWTLESEWKKFPFRPEPSVGVQGGVK